MLKMEPPHPPVAERRTRCLVTAAILCALVSGGVSAFGKPVTSGDLYARVLVARRELEELRRYMGYPKCEPSTIAVDNVSPREIHAMALVMLASADRVGFEHTRQQSSKRSEPGDITALDDTLPVINKSIEHLRIIKKLYGLQPSSDEVPVLDDRTTADVYASLVAADRQLNRMLDRPVESREVHRQVTIATLYAAKLLEQFNTTTPLPSPPEFEPNKNPAEVYARLLRCLKQVRQIASTMEVEMLTLEPSKEHLADVETGDVLELALVLTAQLQHLHSLVPEIDMPEEVYYVDRKFPSHVYQSAGTLEQQLAELTRAVRANPRWLLGNPMP
jgi:hypothetical protein